MALARFDTFRLVLAVALAALAALAVLLWTAPASANMEHAPVEMAEPGAEDPSSGDCHGGPVCHGGSICHGGSVCHNGGLVLGDGDGRVLNFRPGGPGLSDTRPPSGLSPSSDPPVPIA